MIRNDNNSNNDNSNNDLGNYRQPAAAAGGADHPAIGSPEDRKRRFLEEFEKPFKCEKCSERFKKKKYLREHKSAVHSY